MSPLLINPSLYKCYNYLIYINVLCASSVHPKGVNGIACIIYILIVSSCTLWYCMYYIHPHCLLMYPMVLNLLYKSHCLLMYPMVLHLLCVEKGYCISRFWRRTWRMPRPPHAGPGLRSLFTHFLSQSTNFPKKVSVLSPWLNFLNKHLQNLNFLNKHCVREYCGLENDPFGDLWVCPHMNTHG